MESTADAPVALVVDDEPTILEVAARALRQLGLRVLTSTDGADALDQLRCERDVVRVAFVDWSMPGLSGKALLDAFVALRPDLAIVVMSGLSPDEIVSATRAFERVRVLAKPWRRADLVAIVRELGI